MEQGKLIIISAPSGSGKSTIIGRIMQDESLRLAFSVSATTRPRRGQEVHGVDYYYKTIEEFQQMIENDELVEYQEVYEGRYYGTPKSEVERITGMGKNVVLDLDVSRECMATAPSASSSSHPVSRCCVSGSSTAAPTAWRISRPAWTRLNLKSASARNLTTPLSTMTLTPPLPRFTTSSLISSPNSYIFIKRINDGSSVLPGFTEDRYFLSATSARIFIAPLVING